MFDSPNSSISETALGTLRELAVENLAAFQWTPIASDRLIGILDKLTAAKRTIELVRSQAQRWRKLRPTADDCCDKQILRAFAEAADDIEKALGVKVDGERDVRLGCKKSRR